MGRQRCLPCARRAPLEVKSCRLLTGRGFLTGWSEAEAIQREKNEKKRDNISTQSYFALRFLLKSEKFKSFLVGCAMRAIGYFG